MPESYDFFVKSNLNDISAVCENDSSMSRILLFLCPGSIHTHTHGYHGTSRPFTIRYFSTRISAWSKCGRSHSNFTTSNKFEIDCMEHVQIPCRLLYRETRLVGFNDRVE